MLRWGNRILNAAAVGFAGYALYVCLDYRAHPARYAAQSAPRYTGILVRGLITAAALLILALLKHLLNRFHR